jgi:hypothetical protein
MLRMGSGARRASDCLRAERALCGRRRFRSLSRERNIFSAGLPSRLSRCGSTTSRSTNMYVEAGTQLKRCVLDRNGPPSRQPRPQAPRAALLTFLESLQPAQTMLRRRARSPAAAPQFDRGQHIFERNIRRRRMRPDPALRRRWRTSAIAQRRKWAMALARQRIRARGVCRHPRVLSLIWSVRQRRPRAGAQAYFGRSTRVACRHRDSIDRWGAAHFSRESASGAGWS